VGRSRGALVIGTSGWHYRHWRGNFYPEGLPTTRWFAYYRSVFSSVELNATFYRLPTVQAVQAWASQAPSGFRYAIKGSRFITHNKKLADPLPSLRRLREVIAHLGETLAVILFQLPPTWGPNLPRLAEFLAAYRRIFPTTRMCLEFRNHQWYGAATERLLRDAAIGFCIYHLAGHDSPALVTTDFAYIRLHGSGGRYSGAYDDAALQPWAERIRSWRAQGIDCFCYFDNDVGGEAPRDAVRLRELAREDGDPDPTPAVASLVS